jgi:eukaryotic-like serine/threonine-protein kinase
VLRRLRQSALADLDGKVVHRDLKPENVLRLNGRWCLADFGISRYAEASTAPDTQKYALSPVYAAPERWRSERATISTDVYSFGVVAFELLSGSRPFLGPEWEHYREQHLHVDPPKLEGGTVALRALVMECLNKAPGARPSPANIVTRLQRIGSERPSGGLASLQEAHLAEVARANERERLASVARSSAERRAELYQGAVRSFDIIQSSLLETIVEAAPATHRRTGGQGGKAVGLGEAELEFFPIARTAVNPWEWDAPAFDVVAHAGLIVRLSKEHLNYKGRSHSLWFCDAQSVGRYQWFEVAFMVSPLVGKSTAVRPFLLAPGPEAAKALWRGIAEFQLAWPMEALDTGELSTFIDRWAGWFATAAGGRLSAPSTMPERPTPRNWREA